MANIERVKAVVGHIEKSLTNQKAQSSRVVNILSFNMEEWFKETKNKAGEICGTAMCLAGWGAHYEGLKMFEFRPDEWSYKEIVVDETPDDPASEYKTVENWAAEYFEFTPAEVEIFYQTDISDLEELKGALNYFLEEKVFEEVPDYDPCA